MKSTTCRVCNGTLGSVVLDLGSTTLANELVTRLGEQKKYPLEIVVCKDCQYVQLTETVDPSELFSHYTFESGISAMNIKHFNDFASWSIDNKYAKKSGAILEIASNDGTLLKAFQSKGYETLGVDPAVNIAAQANKNGIETICGFFNKELAEKIQLEHGNFNCIIANNVMAHIPDLNEFVSSFRHCLSTNGVFIFEVAYLIDSIKQMDAFQCYHEHLFYSTITAVKGLLQRNDMEIVDVVRIPTQNGSIRVVAQMTNGPRGRWVENKEWLAAEEGIEQQIISWNEKIQQTGKNLKEKLQQYSDEYKTVALFGVSAKSTTMLQTFGIDKELIDFAIDSSFLKQGQYTSGSHLLIKSPSCLYTEKIDVVLVGAWNFFEGIRKNHSDWKGKWLLPIPEVKEISQNEDIVSI